ncbi:MAG: right-handed parallel beta-helix repeat-containing protein [Candidatus Methanoperedens sp.]|nr:right-handed parallel beta-helix repeat-containing protein [Candidatus Methanoperedens sp.]
MVSNKLCGGHALRIAVGITTLVLLMACGAEALSNRNISSQGDINNSFIMHRLDAGITSNRDSGMMFRNATGELTSKGLKAESRIGRIQENKNLHVKSIEEAAVRIPAYSDWFINDNATGGDCISIGTWNVVSKTCTLTTDLTRTIEIGSDSITLDGNGHTITGSSSSYGIYLSGRSGVTIKNTNVRSFYYGIYLDHSNNNTLSGNNASNNRGGDGINLYDSNYNMLSGNIANSNNDDGIELYSSGNNTLSGNKASNNREGDGIYLCDSNNNMLSGNNANSNNDDGIELYSSGNNTLSGNSASNNSNGIYLYYSSYNILFNNTMEENSINFGLFGWSESDFNNQIDFGNTVDGKPVYYVKNGKNNVYDSSTNAGTFYCISCLNVTIKDIGLLKNDVGILFWNTTSSKIQNVTVSNNGDGIVLLESGNNTLSGNNVYSNDYDGIELYSSGSNTLSGNNANLNDYDGIYLESSSYNTLRGNNATSNNDDGIDLDDSNNNTISGNNASNNSYGIYLYDSGNNILFNNTMTANSFNFGLSGSSDSDFNNQVDYSNTVDDKPIYYVKNANNTVYDFTTNAGTFYCISCLNVTIKDMELSKNEVGILFWNTSISKIQNVTVSNNSEGIVLLESGNSTLSRNNASNNGVGIELYLSGNNTMSDNKVNSNNDAGIVLLDSGNSTLSSNNASNNFDGIVLLDSSKSTLSGNIASNNDVGIVLLQSGSSTLSGNNLSNSYDGIVLLDSGNSRLIDNNASNNSYGIYLEYSSNNTLSGNNASNNTYGIYMDSSSNNMLFNNTMTENSFNFGLYGWSESDFNNQIDYSNTVDGKPIYYVKNAKNTVYDSSTNAGTFYCISCLNVTIKDIELLRNDVGILFWNTTSSKIQNVNVSNNDDGIVLLDSGNNILSGNNVNSNKDDGIYLDSSSNNTLSGNNANLNHDDGMYLGYSSNNMLRGNNADSNKDFGIYLDSTSNNILFNNTMTENSFNFGLYGWSDSDFNNQIDRTNTVDGKPIYYVKNAINTVYDSSTNAGIFYCISCLNVTIKDIEVLKNDIGILFWNTTSSKIQNVTISNNDDGIVLLESGNNMLTGNNIKSNDYDGIYMDSSSYNTLNGNNVNSNNDAGIILYDSGNNQIYDNVFNNTNNFYLDESVSIWNIKKTPGTNIIGGSYLGGNFWANPSGTGFSQTCSDANSDELCDSEYVLDSNNIDYLPLSMNLETIVPLPIDPATGKVNATIIPLSGNVSITIPNGTVAVDENGNSLINLSIDTSVSLTTNATLKLSDNDGVTGSAIELKPEGARFDPPIQIRFNYSHPLPGGVDENSLTVRYFNTTLNGWEVMHTVELNTAQNYIIANISHFSTFALIGTKPISGGGGGSSSGGTYPPGYGTTTTTKTPAPTTTSVATATPASQSPEVPTQTVKPEVTVTTATPAPTAKSSGFGAIIAVFAIAMIASLLKNNRNRR